MIKYETIELTQKDIAKLISDKYGVNIYDVKICVDHGDPQYPNDSVYATVRLDIETVKDSRILDTN